MGCRKRKRERGSERRNGSKKKVEGVTDKAQIQFSARSLK